MEIQKIKIEVVILVGPGTDLQDISRCADLQYLLDTIQHEGDGKDSVYEFVIVKEPLISHDCNRGDLSILLRTADTEPSYKISPPDFSWVAEVLQKKPFRLRLIADYLTIVKYFHDAVREAEKSRDDYMSLYRPKIQ